MRKTLKLKFETLIIIYFITVLGHYQLSLIESLIVGFVGYQLFIFAEMIRKILLTEYEYHLAGKIMEKHNKEFTEKQKLLRMKKNIETAERI